MKKLFVVVAVASAAIASGVALAQAKKESKPTGACTITVYGISPTCTAPMTQDSCNTTAKKVGGTASWQEGKACPRK
jgi:hypothetical protein